MKRPIKVRSAIIRFPHAEVFEITGPLFFGAAFKFKDSIKFIEKKPKVLIIRMRLVPIIDATGIQVLKEVFKDIERNGTRIILSGISSPQVLEELRKSRLIFKIGKANITENFDKARARCHSILENPGNARREEQDLQP